MDPISLIMAAAGAGGNIIGLLEAMKQNAWLNAAFVNQLNRQDEAYQYGRNRFQESFDPIRDRYIDFTDRLGGWFSQNPLFSAYDELGYFANDPNYTRPYEDQLNWLQNSRLERMPGDFGETADYGLGMFRRGGDTGSRDFLFDRINEGMIGAGAHRGTLGDVGLSLLGNYGQTAFTRGLQDRGMDAVNAGGFTPTLQAAQGVGMDVLGRGGRTDLTGAIAGRGMDLFDREALLSPLENFNIAQEQASRATDATFRRALRAALNRGGQAPGVVAAGGAEHDPMSEWADAASRNITDATRNAMVQRQGLGLQEMQTGLQGALGAAGEENRNFLSAMGLFPELQNAATGYATGIGGMGIRGAELENASMGLGGNLLNLFNDERFRYANLYNQGRSAQEQYGLGAGNLGLNAAGAYQSNLGDVFSGYQGMGQNFYNNRRMALGDVMNAAAGMTNMFSGGLRDWSTLAGYPLNFAGSALGNQPSFPQWSNTSGMWQNVGQGLSNVAGNLPRQGSGGVGSSGNTTTINTGPSGIPGYPG